MTSAAPHPRMHGLTHVTGGPDPVPGLLPPFGSYPDVIINTPGLLAYWPLEDLSGIDATGHGHDLTMYGTPSTAAGPFGDLTSTMFDYTGTETSADIPAEDAFHRTDVALDAWITGSTGFTVEAWIYPTAYPSIYGGIVQSADAFYNTPAYDLQIRPDGHIYFTVGAVQLDTGFGLPLNEWTFLVGVGTPAAGTKLYVNGLLAVTGANQNTADVGDHFLIGTKGNVALQQRHFVGRIAQVALYTVPLTATDILNHYELGTTAPSASSDLVLGVDDNGNIGWVQPTVAVTVNGKPQTGSTTPVPLPPTPPAPVSSAYFDQPFVYGGSSFEVPPEKWTTIPFTTPVMTRWSLVTGEGTVWTDIAWDDPDAAGWINPDTPRVITIPHDMPFLADPNSWMQICLRLEGPMVEAETSNRALRIFETTHQKTLVQAYDRRASATEENGALLVYQGDGTSAGQTVFASCDPGGFNNGGHDTIMWVPNAGYAYYLNGNDWLPKVAGVPTLKAGMRLVPQVWHDAHVPVTFHCDWVSGADGFGPWKPCFAVYQKVLTAWGPPWSTW